MKIDDLDWSLAVRSVTASWVLSRNRQVRPSSWTDWLELAAFVDLAEVLRHMSPACRTANGQAAHA
jgi:hypothetical protein